MLLAFQEPTTHYLYGTIIHLSGCITLLGIPWILSWKRMMDSVRNFLNCSLLINLMEATSSRWLYYIYAHTSFQVSTYISVFELELIESMSQNAYCLIGTNKHHMFYGEASKPNSCGQSDMYLHNWLSDQRVFDKTTHMAYIVKESISSKPH